MLSKTVAMLMSPWNFLTTCSLRSGQISIDEYSFDPVDLLGRGMCHHHLGHPKEATAYLNRAHGILGNNEKTIDARQLAFLREAESFIEGKPRP